MRYIHYSILYTIRIWINECTVNGFKIQRSGHYERVSVCHSYSSNGGKNGYENLKSFLNISELQSMAKAVNVWKR